MLASGTPTSPGLDETKDCNLLCDSKATRAWSWLARSVKKNKHTQFELYLLVDREPVSVHEEWHYMLVFSLGIGQLSMAEVARSTEMSCNL